jgi:hypothetical protein
MNTIDNSNDSTADVKAAMINRVREEAATATSHALIAVCTSHPRNSKKKGRIALLINPSPRLLPTTQQIQANCFEKCVVVPGSSLTTKDLTCFKQCAYKYMDAWHAVGRHYVARIDRERGEQPAPFGIGRQIPG